MRVFAWVMDTVQGSRFSKARLVSMRRSRSKALACWEASASRAGEMVRRIVDTHRSASASVYAS
ncbi:hypothetical protein [Streptomyces sp. 4F14]|uniref:hypothetical protein n=1 Tax=Streptomyces sp. 4F14 TaxID=3394380 RepID=UPI003A8739D1